MWNKKGESKLGCLIYLLFFAYAGYILFQVTPMMYKKAEMENQLEVVAKAYYQLKDRPELMYKMILDKARELDLPITRQDIEIKRKRGEVEVAVYFDMEVDFIFTKKVFELRPSASMPVYDF